MGPTGTGTGSGGSGRAPRVTTATLIDGVVNVGTSVTSQILPGPAGSVTTGLLQSLGKGVDSIVGHGSRLEHGCRRVEHRRRRVVKAASTVKTLVPGVQLP